MRQTWCFELTRVVFSSGWFTVLFKITEPKLLSFGIMFVFPLFAPFEFTPTCGGLLFFETSWWGLSCILSYHMHGLFHRFFILYSGTWVVIDFYFYDCNWLLFKVPYGFKKMDVHQWVRYCTTVFGSGLLPMSLLWLLIQGIPSCGCHLRSLALVAISVENHQVNVLDNRLPKCFIYWDFRWNGWSVDGTFYWRIFSSFESSRSLHPFFFVQHVWAKFEY